MIRRIAAVLAFLIAGPAAAQMPDEPMVTRESPYSVLVTIDRLSQVVTEAGGRVFARIDHAQGARAVSMDLRPTELLIFGNPQLGTPVMQMSQTVGLDLPLRALAWEDEDGTVYLSHPRAEAIVFIHGIDPESEDVQRINTVVENLISQALAEE